MMSSNLLLNFLFLGLFNAHFSCNSESVTVHNPENRSGRTAKVQMEDSELKEFISFEGPHGFVIRHMRPVVTGYGEVWREVYREGVDRIGNCNPAQDSRKDIRTNPWNSRRPTVRASINDNRGTVLGDTKRQMPLNRFIEDSNDNQQKAREIFSTPFTVENEEETSESDNPGINEFPKKVSPYLNFFASIVNDFAFKLMESINLESNFIISPLSIFVALSTCYLGTDGRSKTQMEQVMGINDNAVHGEHLHEGIKELLDSVKGETSEIELFVANGMFLAKDFKADAQFAENIKKYYDGELKNLDFVKHPVLSLGYINEWVSENTKNMIKTILNSPLSNQTRLILLNAVYFKGKWETPFDPLSTHIAKFHVLDGNDKEVQIMMLHDEIFSSFQSDEHKHTFIKLPYEGDDVSMIVALPYDTDGKPMPSITDEILNIVREAMVDTEFDFVYIPKFRMEYEKSLISPLKKLGMTDIFGENANFSKLTSEEVKVDEIMHKAAVEVNEGGTTASAVASVKIRSRKRNNLRKASFVADHPFAFYIVHEPTGLVLFYGKVFDIE